MTHDAFAISPSRETGVRAGERPEAPDPEGGRRGRSRDPGAPDGRQSGGRRPLRRRQQPRRAHARGRGLRAVRAAGARDGRSRAAARPGAPRDAHRPRGGMPQLRQALVRGAGASPTPLPRRPHALRVPQPARRREPGHVDAGPRVHARDHRTVRRPLAGLLAQAPGEWRARRRRLGGGVHGTFLGRRGQQRASARSSSPTLRALRPRSSSEAPTERRRRRVSSPTAASGRSSSRASSGEPGTRRERAS